MRSAISERLAQPYRRWQEGRARRFLDEKEPLSSGVLGVVAILGATRPVKPVEIMRATDGSERDIFKIVSCLDRLGLIQLRTCDPSAQGVSSGGYSTKELGYVLSNPSGGSEGVSNLPTAPSGISQPVEL